MAERDLKIGTYGLFISAVLADNPVYLVMVCQTDLSFSRTRDVIDATSKCGPKQLPANAVLSELTGTSQVIFDDGGDVIFGGRASEALCDQLMRSADTFNWKIGPLDGTEIAGDVIYEGEGFFSSLDTSYPAADVATFDFTLTVLGDYTQDVIQPTT